jgi:hypothetical protein
LTADYIRDNNIYVSKDPEVLNQAWYSKYFEELIKGSRKLQELEKFLSEIAQRSTIVELPRLPSSTSQTDLPTVGQDTTQVEVDDDNAAEEKMIIGCSSPPVVTILRLVSCILLVFC